MLLNHPVSLYYAYIKFLQKYIEYLPATRKTLLQHQTIGIQGHKKKFFFIFGVVFFFPHCFVEFILSLHYFCVYASIVYIVFMCIYVFVFIPEIVLFVCWHCIVFCAVCICMREYLLPYFCGYTSTHTHTRIAAAQTIKLVILMFKSKIQHNNKDDLNNMVYI